ncbi:MAG: heavy-metal-associated domain-containing protein [Acholeplasmataceae bacterium]|jgi:copper chaperone CopZ|nr:heavy-metal-associated domain-containing protein [Acholeplasmataceae bacterium]
MKTTLQLETLACPTCAQKIEKVLSKSEGIQSATMAFALSRVTVEYDEAKINVEEMKKIINKLGYRVLSSK